jgi:hypothetical protein
LAAVVAVVVVVDVIGAVVVVGDVVVVVVVWFLRFHVLVGDESVVVVFADVSPMMVSVWPWTVNAPAIKTSAAVWRRAAVKRDPVERL